MKKLSTIYLLSLFVLQLSAQDYRYTESLFTTGASVTVTYATAPQVNSPYNDETATTDVGLQMEIFQPTGDTLSKRPAIIFVHGGAFISGDRAHDDMMAFCDSFARKGYVTATIDYRLGMYTLSPSFTPISGTRAVYRGLQDGRSAVRFLKANAATYGIDTSRVYMAGSSAGGYVALQSIYMNEASEKPAFAGTYDYQDPSDIIPPYTTITAPDLGGYDVGSNLGYDGTPDAIMPLWGAVQDSALVTATDTTPVFLVHGMADGIVPYGVGSPFSVSYIPATHGSRCINNQLEDLGQTEKETYFVPGQGHEFYGVSNGDWNPAPNNYWDTIVDMSTLFFYGQHKPEAAFSYTRNGLELTLANESTGETKYRWVIEDTPNPNDTITTENPVHTFGAAGTYRVELTVRNDIESWDTVSAQITVAPLISFTDISYSVKNGRIDKTTTAMEYELDSSGTWLPCTDMYTTVTFVEGAVNVRQISNPQNDTLLGVVTKPATPSVSIDYYDETTAEEIPANWEYQYINDFSNPYSPDSEQKIELMKKDTTYYFRVEPTDSSIASEVFLLNVPAIPDSPSVSIDYVKETTKEKIPPTMLYNYYGINYDDVDFTIDETYTGKDSVVPVYPMSKHNFITPATDSNFASLVCYFYGQPRPNFTERGELDTEARTFAFQLIEGHPAPGGGTIDFVATDYEYSLDSGQTWTACRANPIQLPDSAIPAGHLQVRVLASNEEGRERFYGDVLKSEDDLGSITSITDIFAAKVNIYPQPASDQLNISIEMGEGSYTYQLFSINGVLQESGQLYDGDNALDVGKYPPGKYVMYIAGENERYQSELYIVR